MSHISLYVGHDEKAQGAMWAGVTEFMLGSALVEYINHPDICILHDDLDLTDTVSHANKDLDCCLAAELHFNAGGTSKTEGCETLFCPGSSNGERAARAFQAAYLKNEYKAHGVETRDRGIKEGWYRMKTNGKIDYFLRRTNMPAIILEPEFIQQACSWYHDEKALKEVAQSITVGLLAAKKALETR